MPRAQRVGLLAVAAVIAVVAVVVLRPSTDDESGTDSQQEAGPGQRPADARGGQPARSRPSPSRSSAPPLLTGKEEARLTFRKGEVVRFRVRSPREDEVHVHGYDITAEAPAGETVTMRFRAALEGIFEVELEQSGAALASLEVRP